MAAAGCCAALSASAAAAVSANAGGASSSGDGAAAPDGTIRVCSGVVRTAAGVAGGGATTSVSLPAERVLVKAGRSA